MIVLTGIVGVTLLLGGLRNDEQEFNLAGALSYLRVLTPMARPPAPTRTEFVSTLLSRP